MLEKLVHTDEKAPDGTQFNDPPIGLRRITEKEFVRSQFFVETIALEEYRQIHVEDKITLKRGRNHMIALKMYWFHDGTGVAIHNDYWGEKVEYFAFGCQHDYHELSKDECVKRGIQHWGMCWHVTECSKCNYINCYDSSD
jgi:hypothetical protein